MTSKLLAALVAATALAGCGGDDDAAPATEKPATAAGADLGAIKG